MIKSAVALLLTFVAGIVDIVGYIGFFHTFTAHMTGNTVHAAHRIVSGRAGSGLFALAVIAAFLGGSILGRAVIEAAARNGVRRAASITLSLEFLLIAFVAFSPAGGQVRWPPVLAILIAVAMGIQTASLTRVGPLTVHTTFVTGMLNKLAQLISHALFLSYDIVVRKRPAHQHRRRVVRDAAFMGFIWVLYFVGAAVGAWLMLRWNLRVLVVALALLAVVVVIDQIGPLSLQEEKDEAH